MKKAILAALLALSMTACTTNGVYDSGKTWTLVGVGAGLALAAASGGSSGGDDDSGQQCYWNGDVRICD